VLTDCLNQAIELAGTFAGLKFTVNRDDRDACRVIAAVFEATKAA
jgi:hypothetical protein